MKIISAVLGGVLLASSAYAQPPGQDAPRPQNNPQLEPAPNSVMGRPTHIVCESDDRGMLKPILRMCPLNPNAPWPPPPKAKPRSGLFPLDRS